MSLWPKIEPVSTIYSSTNQSSDLYKKYIKSRSESLTEYFNQSTNSMTDCDFDNNIKLIDDIQKPCIFERSLLDKCSDPESEMKRGNICAYWKINRVGIFFMFILFY